MAKKKDDGDRPTPEQRKLTSIQAEWLARESGIPAKALAKADIRRVHEDLRFAIDAELLGFRRVCGRVVRRDPETGELWGVPNATVYVEDADTSFLGYFPSDQPYGWLWSLLPETEVLTEVTTDACGRFCVWIPRWDIDRVLRLRRLRLCLPDLFRPSIGDLIEKLRPPKAGPRDPFPPLPGPGPRQPAPVDMETLELLADELGPGSDQRLSAFAGAMSFGADVSERVELLSEPAFEDRPPPLGADLDECLRKLRSPVPREIRDLPLETIDPDSYVGPVLPCTGVVAPEWVPIIGVPDITFRVTQDVDGDGEEETIYSEGYLDVRWNAGEIPPVTLVAAPEAIATSYCGSSGEAEPCEGKPAFLGIDDMPIDADYHDADSGHSVRMNPPREGGLGTGDPILPARSPYAKVLNLMACHRLEGATHQRVIYQHGEIGPAPLLVKPWNALTESGGTVRLAQDPDGWIPIPTGADKPIKEEWVLQWNTAGFSPGLYELHVECKGADGDLVGEPSDKLLLTVDNKRCDLAFGPIRWRQKPPEGSDPAAGWVTLPVECPVIRRRPQSAIELEVPWSAAAKHFRDATLGFSGCGSEQEEIHAREPIETREHWHDSVGDTGAMATAFYEVGGSSPEGAYRLRLSSFTRGFSPRLEVGGEFTGNQHLLWRAISRPIAIVDDASRA